MILSLFRRAKRLRPIEDLYGVLSARSRDPALYLDYGVPDTLEGRLELLSLHVLIALRRLRDLPEPGRDAAQDLVDVFFRELDRAMREMGVGDLAVPKRMKKRAQAFYGRAGAYETALQAGDPKTLAEALGRNVYGGAPGDAERLAAYALEADRAYRSLALEDILNGRHGFPSPAEVDAGRRG